LYEFDYDGGAHSPVAGEVIYVDTEEATEYATIQSWTVASGAWATNDAAGKMWVYSATAAFISNLANNDVIEDSGGTKICDTTGGTTDKEGDWQAPGNWGTGEDPAVPVADDEVVFDGRSTQAPDEGMLDSESGATAQCTYDLLHFKSSWAQGVASAAEPLCCAPDKLVIDGTGTYYILCGKDDQSTDADVDTTIINNKSATVYLYSNANDGANTCQFTEVYVTAGTLYVSYYSVDTDDQGCYIPDLYVTPKNDAKANATVVIAKDCYKVNGTVAGNIRMNNGELTTDSMVGIFEIRNGVVYYGTDLAASPETALDIATLRLHGGTFYWRPDDSGDDAYISDLYVFGGTFNASSTTNRDRAKVLGNGAGNDIYLFEGGTMDLANGMGNITIAASSQFWNFGGTLTVDSYSQLTMTYDQP
jgi:hypothetical protein